MEAITLRNIMITLLLLAAIGLSSWSILISKHSKSKHASTDIHIPDALMEDVVAITMNKEGNPTLKVSTPKMIHYASNDSTDILKPIVTIYRKSPNPWQISSNYARASEGTAKIVFWENVVLSHQADTEDPTTTMETAALTIYPDKRFAETNRAITITQPDVIIHATGMFADMNEGTVKLISKAQGEYVPVS